ncbi:hypothetical protein Tco_0336914 [Tanacetum coccineum]
MDEILKKFGFSTVKTASTHMETSKSLLKDAEAKDIYVYLYRSMIGSLMYLAASRPDIMFSVYACVRFQVTPKVSHLHAVKRIFKYLKGQPKLRLWKSTKGGCQFLRSKLISWQCKKQTIVANSTTESEYVATSSCCGQLVDKKGGSYSANAPRLEPGKFNKWKKRVLFYLKGMEPYYIQYDIIELVISCKTAKSTWTNLVYSFEGPFDTKDKEEVCDDKEMTQVKFLLALVDDELFEGKNHACNGEWIDITMKKVNTLLSMDKDTDWKTYLKYITIYLKCGVIKGDRHLICEFEVVIVCLIRDMECMLWHEGSWTIWRRSFVSVDTNDILTNNEFPILDVGRKIISEDNGRI